MNVKNKGARGRPTIRTEGRDALFFSYISTNFKVKDAALMAGYSVSAVYKFIQNCDEYKSRYEKAKVEAAKRLIEERQRRVLESVSVANNKIQDGVDLSQASSRSIDGKIKQFLS